MLCVWRELTRMTVMQARRLSQRTAQLVAYHLPLELFQTRLGSVSEVASRSRHHRRDITWDACLSIDCGEGSASGVRWPDSGHVFQHCAGRSPWYSVLIFVFLIIMSSTSCLPGRDCRQPKCRPRQHGVAERQAQPGATSPDDVQAVYHAETGT